MGLTLEEQERRAYISSDTGRAALLVALVDGDELIAKLEQALKALEASRAYVDPRMLPGHDAAIRALREALA